MQRAAGGVQKMTCGLDMPQCQLLLPASYGSFYASLLLETLLSQTVKDQPRLNPDGHGSAALCL